MEVLPDSPSEAVNRSGFMSPAAPCTATSGPACQGFGSLWSDGDMYSLYALILTGSLPRTSPSLRTFHPHSYACTYYTSPAPFASFFVYLPLFALLPRSLPFTHMRGVQCSSSPWLSTTPYIMQASSRVCALAPAARKNSMYSTPTHPPVLTRLTTWHGNSGSALESHYFVVVINVVVVF